ncbi:hypothetical protein [Aminipila sp.]|uniref:hypothetical protein n=1 Tax=Aminipila sp. TaxID=2060095 RepID=UPI002897DE9D|nr:hypothetical protein [Aminipila sp.]
MDYTMLALLLGGGLLAYNEISMLKKRVQSQEKRLNELAEITGNDNLSSFWIADEVKELAIHLKKSGKEVEAIKKIREHTQMTLIEAKHYVDELD